MVDVSAMIRHVDNAKDQLEQAVTAFSTADRITPTTAYAMGHLRACLSVCACTRAFLVEAQTKAEAKNQKPK